MTEATKTFRDAVSPEEATELSCQSADGPHEDE